MAENVTLEKESVKSTKKVDLSSKVVEREEIAGYVTSKYAARFLSEQVKKEVPVTTVNNSAYAGKIEAFRIGGIFLLKFEGDNSVTSYIDVLNGKNVEKSKTAEKKERATKVKRAKELFAKYVNDAIAKGETPDLDALRKELGL